MDEIKVGDYVKIIDPSVRKFYYNQFGRVRHIYKGDPYGPYNVYLDNGCNDSFFREQLELLMKDDGRPFICDADNRPINA